jgi:hypothetical protein
MTPRTPVGLWIIVFTNEIFVNFRPSLIMRFEVLTAVKMSMLVFWVVTPCGLVGRFQRFRKTYCLHLLGLNIQCRYKTIIHRCNQQQTSYTSLPKHYMYFTVIRIRKLLDGCHFDFYRYTSET